MTGFSWKSAIKSLLFIILGISLAALLLFIYTRVTSPPVSEPEYYPPIELKKTDVFIAGISGEVFIKRQDRLIPAAIGDILQEGDVIQVVDQSYCQIQFADRGQAGLEGNTVMLLKKWLNVDSFSLRTEVLMGSMLYRVIRQKEDDVFQVESQGVLYDVRGTEFLVAHILGETYLAVNKGSVAVSSRDFDLDRFPVTAGNELFLDSDSSAEVLPLGEYGQELINKWPALPPVDGDEESVVLRVTAQPVGAEIYLDGRMIAHNHFTGLFNKAVELSLLVRKRGYKDYSDFLSLTDNETMDIRLELAELDATLNAPPPVDREWEFMTNERDRDNRFESERKEYEARIEQNRLLLDKSKDRGDNLEKRIFQLENAVSEKEREIDKITDELKESQEEVIQLRALLDQIKNLTDQD